MRIEIGEELEGMRLDAVVVRVTLLGRANAKRLFADGRVELIRGDRVVRPRKGELAEAGTSLILALESADPKRADPDATIPISVVHEDAQVVIVDKPAGMPSAPLRPGERGTVASALLARYPEMAEQGFSAREPGLCHRLDTHTSGLVLAARTTAAFTELTAAIRAGGIDKRYLLLCEHAQLADDGVIEQPLRAAGKRVKVDARGRAATTRYRVVERYDRLALVEAAACPATRHQIRAHFAFAGAPLVGDAVYGGDATQLRRGGRGVRGRLALAGSAA